MRNRLRLTLTFVGVSFVTACGGGGTSTTPITPPTVASVAVSPGTADLSNGGTVVLQADLRSASGVVVSAAVTWASSNTAAVTVAGNGSGSTVTAVATGTAIITATSGSASGTATITVRNVGTVGALIVDDVTTAPLANVTVDFTCGGAAGGSTRTGADGRFTSAALPAGNCSVTATFAGFEVLSLATVAVQAGLNNNLGTLRLKKPPLSDVSGVVRNSATNAVIVGATVEIRLGANVTTGAALAATTTSGSGFYQFSALAAGTYTVSASAPGFVLASIGSVAVVAGTSRTQDVALTASLANPGLGIGFAADQFARVAAGSFQMGSATGDADERPPHTVAITRDFLMQRTEVTQAQWRDVTGTSPSVFSTCGTTCAVEGVSWSDIQAFLTTLNQRDPGKNYRLPTEAEWEFAARAGTTGDYNVPGRSAEDLGWVSTNSGSRVRPVAQKVPNALGLFDMHGNVWEWVQDWYSATYYSASPASDPAGPVDGTNRVLRSGSWFDDALSARSAVRDLEAPSGRFSNIGFRLVRNP